MLLIISAEMTLVGDDCPACIVSLFALEGDGVVSEILLFGLRWVAIGSFGVLQIFLAASLLQSLQKKNKQSDFSMSAKVLGRKSTQLQQKHSLQSLQIAMAIVGSGTCLQELQTSAVSVVTVDACPPGVLI